VQRGHDGQADALHGAGPHLSPSLTLTDQLEELVEPADSGPAQHQRCFGAALRRVHQVVQRRIGNREVQVGAGHGVEPFGERFANACLRGCDGDLEPLETDQGQGVQQCLLALEVATGRRGAHSDFTGQLPQRHGLLPLAS
jgi:hypothetical protein